LKNIHGLDMAFRQGALQLPWPKSRPSFASTVCEKLKQITIKWILSLKAINVEQTGLDASDYIGMKSEIIDNSKLEVW